MKMAATAATATTTATRSASAGGINDAYERQLRHNTYHRDHSENSAHLPKQNTARPFFHPHPHHRPIAVGMAAAVGYSALLTARIAAMRGIGGSSDVLLPLRFDLQGQPSNFVGPRWGSFVYTLSLGYALAMYLVGDRGRYLPAEAGLVYGTGAALIAICHHQASAVVFSGTTASEVARLRESGLGCDFSVDGSIMMAAAAIFGLTTASVLMRSAAEKRERREAGGALDAL